MALTLFLCSTAGAFQGGGGESRKRGKGEAAKIIEGTISGYECGDNCYLTITDQKGIEHIGLCTARPICTNWNQNAMMPNSYKGKRVRVTIGKGAQLTGAGEAVGTVDAFIRIQFTESETPSKEPMKSIDGTVIDTAVIDKFISKQLTYAHGGDEYKDARRVVVGDLNRDGVPDLAVLYTIEGVYGAINCAQSLAVFIRAKGGLSFVTQTVVGAKGIRTVELQSIRNNVIFFKTFNWVPNDPGCCPSKEGTTRFVLANRRLKER
jgi:hypothetical protein